MVYGKYGNYFRTYFNNPTYWNKQAWANSVDQDQTPQNAASDQGLHCLPLSQAVFGHDLRTSMITGVKVSQY